MRYREYKRADTKNSKIYLSNDDRLDMFSLCLSRKTDQKLQKQTVLLLRLLQVSNHQRRNFYAQ